MKHKGLTLSPHSTYLVLLYDTSMRNPPLTIAFVSPRGETIQYQATSAGCGEVVFLLDSALSSLPEQVTLHVFADNMECILECPCVLSKMCISGIVGAKLCLHQ